MNIRIAVLRNQAELSLQCISGEYNISYGGGSEPFRAGEERKFSLSGVLQPAWCKRVRMATEPFTNALITGVEGTTDNSSVTSRRWLQLESSIPPETPDSLYAQAAAIARSEAHDGELFYRDERPNPDSTIIMGWRTVSAPILIIPASPESEIKIFNVRVGIGFHWDKKQDLTYRGTLAIHSLADGLCAVVETPLEEYLAVVNSSEMPADLPIEFLKAQTVAARSWLLANLGTHHPGAPFDVCSDDHCQCYHGSTKLQENSVKAAHETNSQILVARDAAGNKRITDARYAKTCGGRVEPGERVWGGETPGLLFTHDNADSKPIAAIESESEAIAVINDKSIDDYCNPNRYEYPASLEYCKPFYRWTKEIPLEQLTNLVIRSTGIEIGKIKSITGLEWGPSGRLHRLRIEGSKDSIEITGELAIRRALSESHLPSSAIIVSIDQDVCRISGAGWGHGAGLCQTGAAVRATLGQNYREILNAYYPNSKIETLTSLLR